MPSAAFDQALLLVHVELKDARRRARQRPAGRHRTAPGSAQAAPAGGGGSGTRRPGSAALPGTRRFPSRPDNCASAAANSRDGNGYNCSIRIIATLTSFVGASRLQQVVVHLAAAGDHALHARALQRIDLGDHGLEPALPQVAERRTGQPVAQQAFRRHHHQRLAQVLQHLPAQHVEHLRRRGGHADLHVHFGAQLQESLQARRGMLRPLPFLAVRQQQGQAAQAAPLGLAGADELVDHHLGAIDEVAELRLPRSPGTRARWWHNRIQSRARPLRTAASR